MVEPEHISLIEQLQRLRGSYDRLIRAVEQTADTVLITNRKGVIEYANPAFEELSGYSVSEALGRTPSFLKSGLHDAQFYQALWALLLDGKPFRGIIINRKKTGELYWVAQTISSMRDENGEITHFVSVMKDMTELRKQQQQEFYLQIAHEVQQRLNSTVASLPGFDIAANVRTAALTGGDYFDFIAQPDGCLCIAIGDVSGHGFGSALVMAETRAYVRSFAMLESAMGAILGRVNKALMPDLEGGQHVTLLLVRLDPRNLQFEYAGAGHTPGYLLDSTGKTRHVLESTSPPLGFFADNPFGNSPAIPLNYGDTLMLLTDGVTEAENVNEIQFGADRALEYIRDHLRSSSADLVHGILEAVQAFTGGGPLADDSTSVICKASYPSGDKVVD